jgi:hypothetical protein
MSQTRTTATHAQLPSRVKLPWTAQMSAAHLAKRALSSAGTLHILHMVFPKVAEGVTCMAEFQ